MAHARYEESAEMFGQVTSLAPDSFIGFYNLGGVRVQQGKYSDAIPLLEVGSLLPHCPGRCSGNSLGVADSFKSKSPL